MKIGLEIHQRIAGKKLFCNCPAELSEDSHSLTITRRLHPVFSEMGEMDIASKAEETKDRTFEYHAFESSNCLVELDEEPPNTMDLDALRTSLAAALQMNARPIDEVYVMRKTVIDGSNTSGFQRTAIIALNGHVESSKGTVKIPQIALEEESAGIVSSSSSNATYRLDRLGIPLIEITTAPDIKDGEHLHEVAKKIGMMLRATGKVARGLGTIRQDVNISTDGGARVEIKGAQDLKMLPVLVEYENQRQLELVKILTELRNREALPIKKRACDTSSLFSNTKSKLIKKGLERGDIVLAQKLRKHAGILGRELQKGKRYGTELSNYAKTAGVKGIIHSDEDLSKYAISENEKESLCKELKIGKDDAFVLVVADEKKAHAALEFVLLRTNMDFVPEETRKANPDGTSSYMRPISGKARLYPETDVPPIPVTEEFLSSIESMESLEEKQKKLEKVLNKEMAAKILRSRHLHMFERIVSLGTDPMLAATTLENTVVSLRREGVVFTDLETTLMELFEEYKKGTFVKAAIPEVLKGMAKGARIDAVLKVFRLQKLTGKDLEEAIRKCNYDMKKVMMTYRLQVDAKEVSEIIKKHQPTDYI